MEKEVSGLCLVIKQGIILGGDSDIRGSSGENGSVDCMLAAYLAVKLIGLTHPPRRGYRQDPAMPTSVVIGATHRVCKD